jgi:molybdenum cofactor guanylyltransferase
MSKPHQKHANIQKTSFGNFARNEIAFLGTPCSEIKNLFEKIIQNFPNKKFAIVEADHKAEEELSSFSKFTDKINFHRFDSNYKLNKFENRPFFENVDLVLVNGNHFEAKAQVIIIDSRKSLENKLHKLTDVKLIVLLDSEIPAYLLQHFGNALPPVLALHQKNEIFNFIEVLIKTSVPQLFGLVLAGGKSTRMGMDKGELSYHSGSNQKEFAKNLLKKHCGEQVFLSLNEAQAQYCNEAFIKDTFLDLGPLGGILSAFQKYPDGAWMVIACDMPFLTEKSIDQLVTKRNPSKFATTFKSPHDEFPEPLITIWEPKAYPKLLQMLAYGYDCPRKALINSDIELLINTHEKELQNINTVEQFEKAIIDLSPKIV